MANVQKYTRSDLGGGSLTRHYERAKDGEGKYYTFNNQDIDPTLTHKNYNLAPIRDQGQLSFANDRIGEVKCHKRDDVSVMCSWVVTVPRNPKKPDGELGELVLNLEEQDRFFEESYKFLCGKYGEKNVISAYVHLDEVTPHMHFAFVPVVVDKKKGHEKVSAKEALGWSERGLNKFHGELEAHMAGVFGRDIGMLNETTKDGNQSIDELKRGTAVEIMQSARDQAAQIVRQANAKASKIVSEGQARVDALKKQRNALQGKIEGLEAALQSKILAEEKIAAIPVVVSRSMFGSADGSKDKVSLLLSDWENVKKTAIRGARSIAQEKKNSSIAKSLDKREQSLKIREDAVTDNEAGLNAQRKRADHWVSQARTYEANYNRVLNELNQIRNRRRTQELDL